LFTNTTIYTIEIEKRVGAIENFFFKIQTKCKANTLRGGKIENFGKKKFLEGVLWKMMAKHPHTDKFTALYSPQFKIYCKICLAMVLSEMLAIPHYF